MSNLIPNSVNSFAEDMFLLAKNRYGLDFDDRGLAYAALRAVHYTSTNSEEKLLRDIQVYRTCMGDAACTLIDALSSALTASMSFPEKWMKDLVRAETNEDKFNVLWHAIAFTPLAGAGEDGRSIYLPVIDPQVEAFLHKYGMEPQS